jgi:hypothetical protein
VWTVELELWTESLAVGSAGSRKDQADGFVSPGYGSDGHWGRTERLAGIAFPYGQETSPESAHKVICNVNEFVSFLPSTACLCDTGTQPCDEIAPAG